MRKNFKEKFVGDWDADYQSAPIENFLAEKPKVYYKLAEEDYYGQLDKNKFELKMSQEGYNSIHYVINYNGVYIELQVRTILDEAWGECTHDIVYKNAQTDKELKIMAKCLSEQVKAAETITEFIYDRTHAKKRRRLSDNGPVNNAAEMSDADDELINAKKRTYCKQLNKRLNSEEEK